MNLYYRLNVLRLKLPPLREHPEDILLEVETFVSQWCSDELLASRVNEILQKHEGLLAAHTWPGNVRELQNVVKRVIALVETMTGNSVE